MVDLNKLLTGHWDNGKNVFIKDDESLNFTVMFSDGLRPNATGTILSVETLQLNFADDKLYYGFAVD